MAVVLAKVVADDNNFGLLFINNKVAASAPALDYMRGWDGHRVKLYCDEKGWKIERVDHKYDVVE